MKPILFNTDMVRAILDGSKTVTRRVVKPQPAKWQRVENLESGQKFVFSSACEVKECNPPCRPGDILYVRETFQIDYLSNIPGSGRIHYKADDTYNDFDFAPERYEMMRRAQLKPGWSPNENMPREAARIFLWVTGVRVERLQDITVEDILREGTPDEAPPPICLGEATFPEGFEQWSDAKRDEWYNGTARARYIGWCDYADKLIRKFIVIWNNCYAKPRPVKGKDGKIDHYESYPWEDILETRIHRGKPWYVIGNPWVWVIEFDRCEKPEGEIP